MLPQDFKSTRAGRLETRIYQDKEYHAFVPEPLPPQLEYAASLVVALSDADAALGQLTGVGRQLPNPHVLMTPYVRREAVLSSRIEGTHASVADIFANEALHASATDQSPDIQEVRNYVAALEYGVGEVKRGRPITLDLVLDLHRLLMTGVRGKDKQPGEFRTVQNWIGRSGSTPATAIFVPPHPDRIRQALHDWAEFVQQNSRDLPPIIACALLHQQFETIHPFRDGNGRVGRLLIPLYLIARGRLQQPVLYLSAFIEARKAEYAQHLQAVRTDGAWEAWTMFIVHGVNEMAREGSARAAAIGDYYEFARNTVAESPNSVRLLRTLLNNPFISTTTAATALNVTPPTARKALATLTTHGILEKYTKKGRTPLLVARRLLSLFADDVY